ncbi:hypothetical protein LJR118_003072 [Acidovorax sp. LjRoot118]|uniref:hypothetical protein n=1 Tax=Acidovorax sp. LjRoot118 TaxID=3342256 RepID=UPI003ED0208F
MLVVGGDQATILAHLQAGGVRGAEPFAGVTLVPVDQAVLAQQVLSRPLAAPADPQAGRGSQRASAMVTLPGTRAAAQLAPATARKPTAGDFTAGLSAVGADAPRTGHGSQANAGAFQPVPVMEMQRDGTLMVRGDPTQLQERLRQGGVDRVLRREGGVVVGLDQVHKARQLLQQSPHAQASAGPAATGQQFSRSAPPSPDRPSRAMGLPSQPATVQSVRAAVAKLTNSMGLLAEGRGRVVVATSADIQAHREPMVGEVDMGSPDTSLAQGFFDPNTDTVFLIADHIEAGQEMAVAAHELVHKHGKAVLGKARWRQLHEVIGSWAIRPEGSLERRVHDEAMARVQASQPARADETSYSSEELFPYAVQVAMELGVQPTALMPNNSVQGWLARVRASLKDVLGKLTGNPQAFDGQDLVDLAFGIAQLERSASAPPQNGLERANGSAPSAPYFPIQMSRGAGVDNAGAAPEKGPLGTETNPRPIPFKEEDLKVRMSKDNPYEDDIALLVEGEYVSFANIEDTKYGPRLNISKTAQMESKEYIKIDDHGVTEAMLRKIILYYTQERGGPPTGLPGNLAGSNLENFRKEFDRHRKINHNGTKDDWAQAAIRDISFGKSREKLGYGIFEIELSDSIDIDDLKNLPKNVNIISRPS